ncbi:MAG: IS1634 family transposase [Actinobacteria bacterium]|nr:MAG: IS1634 family transposase [Actinomycetota bacterium]
MQGPFELSSERLGPLPLLNHFISILGLAELIDAAVPTSDGRCRLAYAKAVGVLVRSIACEREPVYRLAEAVSSFAPEGFGLGRGEADSLADDAVGRALDRLFDADRASLTTEVVIAAQKRFALTLSELHNDSTTVKFCGAHSKAKGRSIRGKKAPFITYGYSKDHRPDLKQLLFILTTTSDGGVPIMFRCCAGNASDSRSHEETRDALRAAVGSPGFLYVADSKLCSQEATEYIDRRGGRFVCVLPRSRSEDSEFRAWIQDHAPAWEKVRDTGKPQGQGRPPGPLLRGALPRLLPGRLAALLGFQHASATAPGAIPPGEDRLGRAGSLRPGRDAFGPPLPPALPLRGEKEDRRHLRAPPRRPLPEDKLEAGDRTYLPPGEAGAALARHQVRAPGQEALLPHLGAG